MQEIFGLTEHPSLAGGRVPLTLHLLSPAHRPIQITRDLPGFWRGSWAGVRADLRGRYPRHFWPEDPGRRRADRAGEAERDVKGRTRSDRPQNSFKNNQAAMALKGLILAIAFAERRLTSSISKEFCSRKK